MFQVTVIHLDRDTNKEYEKLLCGLEQLKVTIFSLGIVAQVQGATEFQNAVRTEIHTVLYHFPIIIPCSVALRFLPQR